MAKEDYNVADRNADFPVTAGDKVAETVQETPDADAKAFADAEGVSQAAYANYADALNAHQSRADIETLADRRTRGQASTFAAADFMRNAAYDEDGEVVDPPRPGTVEGDAPASS